MFSTVTRTAKIIPTTMPTSHVTNPRLGPNLGLVTWLVGMVVGIIFAVLVTVLNIQKWVIVIATGLMGAGVIVGTFLFMLGKLPSKDVMANPVHAALSDSPL